MTTQRKAWTLSSLRRFLGMAALLMAAACAPATAQTYYRFGIPDIDQRRYDIPGLGSMYCAPTSAVNWMFYLANRGYPNLTIGSDDPMNFAGQENDLENMGALMDTDAEDGTNFGGMVDGLNDWLWDSSRPNYPGYFYLYGYTIFDDTDIYLSDMMDWMAFGGLINVIIGWYNWMGPDEFDRDGGHIVTLAGARKPGDGRAYIWFNDPAADEDPNNLFAQSAFKTHYKEVEGRYAEFDGENARTLHILGYSGNKGYIDGYLVILPIIAVSNTGGHITIHANNLLGGQWEETSHAPALRADITEIAMHPLRPHVFYLQEGGDAIWDMEMASGRSSQFAALSGVQRIAFGGRKQHLYALYRPNLLLPARVAAYDKTGRVAASITPSGNPAAIAWDAKNDRLVCASTADSRLYFYNADLQPVGSLNIPAVPGSGKVEMSVNPKTGDVWLHRQYVTQALVVPPAAATGPRTVTLQGADRPEGLHADQDNNLFFCDGSVLKQFDAQGRPMETSPLAGRRVGTLLTLGRTFTNFDPATMSIANNPGYRHVLPTDDAPWDVNRDGSCDDADLGIILAQQGLGQDDLGFDPAADINEDGAVDDADLGLVLAHQGE